MDNRKVIQTYTRTRALFRCGYRSYILVIWALDPCSITGRTWRKSPARTITFPPNGNLLLQMSCNVLKSIQSIVARYWVIFAGFSKDVFKNGFKMFLKDVTCLILPSSCDGSSALRPIRSIVSAALSLPDCCFLVF